MNEIVMTLALGKRREGDKNKVDLTVSGFWEPPDPPKGTIVPLASGQQQKIDVPRVRALVFQEQGWGLSRERPT